MFIDWNHNGEIDPMDIGLTLAMIDEEERKRAEEKAQAAAELEQDQNSKIEDVDNDYSLI